MYNCIESSKDDKEKQNEDEVKGNDQDPSDIRQTPNIEEIKAVEITQDKEEIIHLQPFEGMHSLINLNQENDTGDVHILLTFFYLL